MSIKVLIADDHALLRHGIKRVLNFEDDLEIVGEAADGQEALARTLVLQPDVLLLDINMPVLSGIEVTRQILAAKVKTKIIILTVHDSSNYVLEMLRIGAHGYLLKDVEPATLVKAIHAVAAGHTFVHPTLMERIFGTVSDDGDLEARIAEMWRSSRGGCLTEREMDVLTCIAKGFSNQDIAAALFVSEKTVKNHLTNIFRKLGVNDRTQALLYCLKRKIITLD